MGKRTPFYDWHVKAKAKIVDFAGWEMPLHYGSQIDEHHIVRNKAGVFDVSHMGVVDVQGIETFAFLRYLLANNVDRIPHGKALYTCMLNEQGGIIDDLIVYKITDEFCRLVINAGTREKDLAWMQKQSKNFAVTLHERNDLVMLAVQGPHVKNTLAEWLPATLLTSVASLKPFSFIMQDNWLVARTGYTGEDGFEIIFPATVVDQVWQAILSAEIKPCGLGARDTLRLEAGLNLYGLDMDETVTPLESNLAWTVAFEPIERAFVGRRALEQQQQQGNHLRLIGLVLNGPGIMRHEQKVWVNNRQGVITSGGYAPTLAASIALARVPHEISDECLVEIRNKQIPAKVVKPPFVRNGKKMVTVEKT